MKRNSYLNIGLILAFALSTQGGCAGPASVQKKGAEQPVNATTPAPTILAGKVVETMNVGSYTYMLLEKDGVKGWAAVPVMTVTVGQEIQLRPGTEMGRFTSKTLNRTFDNIVFSAGPVTNSTPKAPPAGGAQQQMPPGHPGADKADADKTAKPKGMAAMSATSGGEEMQGKLAGKVVETMDSGNYTYVALEKDGKKTWAAVPVMPVTIGQELELQPGAAMPNFTSKSLHRTFESIIFSPGPVVTKQ
jgi:hypothetical protein